MAMRMHDDEVELSEALVRRFLLAQMPHLADRRLSMVEPWGTDNAIWCQGEDLVVRLPRIGWSGGQVARDAAWLPRLAPHLPVGVPDPSLSVVSTTPRSPVARSGDQPGMRRAAVLPAHISVDRRTVLAQAACAGRLGPRHPMMAPGRHRTRSRRHQLLALAPAVSPTRLSIDDAAILDRMKEEQSVGAPG